MLCLALVLLILAFYNPIVHNGFTNFDDNGYITDNVHVQQGLTWATVKWAFSSIEGANWHPLTWLSHALDYQLFKLNPVGHHYMNVLLHSVNAILLFLLLEGATEWTWPSLMVGALFALHPVNVESVAWAAERKNVLSMLFFLLTMLAYQRYVRDQSIKKYAVVFALFALGLMAKPEIITLPFVLLLWDYWPLQRMAAASATEQPVIAAVPRSFVYLVLEKTPLFLLSACSAVITLVAQRAGNAVLQASLHVRIENALVSYARYVGKAFWPNPLLALYPHPGASLTIPEIVSSALLLLVLTAGALNLRSRRYLAVGWFWFLGTLVPVIGFVQVGMQAMADRYAYLSYTGLFVAIIWSLTEVASWRKVPTAWLAAPVILILGTLGMLTRRQITYWHDGETLWRHALTFMPQDYLVHNELATALENEGRTDEAIAEFNASEELHAYPPSALVAVGIYEQTHGRLQQAIEQYGKSLDVSDDAKSRSNALAHLASAFLQMGDVGRAREGYQQALAQNPDSAVALVGTGLLAEREGNFALAASQISRGMTVEPTDVGYLLLAEALHRDNRVEDANDAFARARQLSRNIVQAEHTATEVMATAGIRSN